MKSFLAIFLVFLLQQKSGSGKSNHAVVSPISLHSCDDSEKYVFIDFKKASKESEKAWSGNITVPFNVDANTEFVWEFRWWKNGEWDKNAKIFKGKVCFYLTKFAGKVWRAARTAAKPPIENDCPVNAGTYVFNDVVTDYGDIILPTVGKGKWLGKITITKEGKTLCGNLIVDMI